MADKAREWTDEQLEKLEKKISKEYKQAEKELTQKWNAYMEKGEARLSALEQAVSDAKKSGDKDLIKEAQDKLQKAKENYTLQNTHYKDMVDSVTMDIAKVNQQALSYINGQLPNIYATNYEQVKDSLDELPVSYSLHNKSTVMNMIDKGDIKLPKKKINIPKDQRWNTKKINSSVLQGILQGEPMDKIAKRLLPIMDNNKVSAIRNARTLVTGAENRGRLDSYKELEDQGIVLKKVWIATGDDRTRDSHLMLDGEEIDIDEEFPNGCQYPADPDCDEPSEVYNCRCSMRTHVVGFRKDDGSINYVDYEHEEGLHQQQIEAEKEKRSEIVKEEPEKELFVPAQTIEEAENYAKRFVEESKWSGSGNVSFKGMSVDVANKVNETLTNVFNEYNLPPLRNIEPMNLRKNIFKNAKDAPFCYRNAFAGDLYFNPNIIKTEKTITAYMQKGQEAFDYCKNNIDKFSGSQREMVEIYLKAGRQTVADTTNDPLKAMIEHEMGHHVQHQIIASNKDYVSVIKEGFDEYSGKISGYATSSTGEYIAESFSAFNNQNGNLIDPQLSQIFEEIRR